MVLPSVVIKLEPAEVVELRRVTLDEDARAALEFLRDVLLPRLEETLGRGHRVPTKWAPLFEWGGRDLTPAEPPQ